MTASPFRLVDGRLWRGERLLLEGVDPQLTLEALGEDGALLSLAAPPRPRHRLPAGAIPHLVRATCWHRSSPYWMVPSVITSGGRVPRETQGMLAQLADGSCLLLAPLVGERLRWTLEAEQGRIGLNGSANDAGVLDAGGPALFLAQGQDPYALMGRAAAALGARLGYRRRLERQAVPLASHLGWCTYNAFYADLSHAKIRAALASLRDARVPVRWALIDGGWQQKVRAAGGEDWMAAIAADPAKFPDGLAATIRMCKEEFGLGWVMVWHALFGLPSGMADHAVPGVPTVVKTRQQTPGIYAVEPTIDDWFGLRASVPRAEDAPRFFEALHAYLAQAGTDAVKVDFQSTLEAVCQGEGGRVAYDRAWRSALEASCARHFEGGLINCMSLSSECVYLARGSRLTRSSDDYYPNQPHLHGLHLATNAQMGMWFGEFFQPDWDMFESGHPYGGYHGAGRALSGGPVLLTDAPGTHDVARIGRLCLPDGSLLPLDGPARPCPDSLFADPVRQPQALKLFNRAGTAGVVGLFHACHDQRLPIRTSVSAEDVPGLAGQEVVVYLHHADRAVRLQPGERWELELPHAGHEVASIAPVREGIALLGLAERYAGIGALAAATPSCDALDARWTGGGSMLVWSAHAAAQLRLHVPATATIPLARGLSRVPLAPGTHQGTIVP